MSPQTPHSSQRASPSGPASFSPCAIPANSMKYEDWLHEDAAFSAWRTPGIGFETLSLKFSSFWASCKVEYWREPAIDPLPGDMTTAPGYDGWTLSRYGETKLREIMPQFMAVAIIFASWMSHPRPSSHHRLNAPKVLASATAWPGA